jgi:hypothetical protein
MTTNNFKEVKMPNKHEDNRKRNNFFYQTLNNADVVYSPTITKLDLGT